MLQEYLTNENAKKTQKLLVCCFISAFKKIIMLYDEKNGKNILTY